MIGRRFTADVLSELFARKLLGRTDIEDALKRLDRLIQAELQMVMAQVLKATTEIKDGTRRYRLTINITLKVRPSRCQKNKPCRAADIERYGASQARSCGGEERCCKSEGRSRRSEVRSCGNKDRSC